MIMNKNVGISVARRVGAVLCRRRVALGDVGVGDVSMTKNSTKKLYTCGTAFSCLNSATKTFKR